MSPAMLEAFSIEKLAPASFSEQLRALLEDARRLLRLRGIALAELAAEQAVVAPRWRVWSPWPRLPHVLSMELFERLQHHQALHTLRPLSADERRALGPPFDDCHNATLLSLHVTPALCPGPDTLLIALHEPNSPFDGQALQALQRCLEHGLSLDRKRRIAELVFQAVQQAADPIELTDREARLLYANAAWEQTFGYVARDVIGQTVGKLFRDPVAPLHDSAFYQFTLARIAEGRAWTGALACRTRDGSRVFCEPMVSQFDASEQGFRGNIAVRRSLAQRAEREAALAIAHHEFRTVLAAVPEAVAVLRDGRLYFVNTSFLQLVGRSEQAVIGLAYAELIYQADRAEFLTKHELGVMCARFVREDGSVRFAEISTAGELSFEGKPAMIVLARDITEQRIAQEQLTRAERLSALGALAAGVAHEINNPLSYVLLNLRCLEDNAQLGERTQLALLNALDGATRIQQIVQELRGYCGTDAPGKPEPVDVSKAASSAINIAQNQIRHRARLERVLEDDLHVLAREGKLVQVLVNLLINAAQAIPESDGKRHLISVRSCSVSETLAQIEITDSGVGIAPELLPHVFEPFSTTKRRGEGSGLGLAISKRIVEELGGQISIHSQLGHGCRVLIELPRSQRDAITAKYLRPIASDESGFAAARLKLLVIDDEVAIATTLQDILLDYAVTVAVSARQATELLESGRSFDAVLCDLMMPDVTGPELYRVACRVRPEIAGRFIFMTGGAFTEQAREFLEHTSCLTLSKPFTIANVYRVVEQTVGQASSFAAGSACDHDAASSL
jgi:PAS domain S-box-containing protein